MRVTTLTKILLKQHPTHSTQKVNLLIDSIL